MKKIVLLTALTITFLMPYNSLADTTSPKAADSVTQEKQNAKPDAAQHNLLAVSAQMTKDAQETNATTEGNQNMLETVAAHVVKQDKQEQASQVRQSSQHVQKQNAPKKVSYPYFESPCFPCPPEYERAYSVSPSGARSPIIFP